jgi:hypothetical protein
MRIHRCKIEWFARGGEPYRDWEFNEKPHRY